MSDEELWQRAVVSFDGMRVRLSLYRANDAARVSVELSSREAFRLARDLLEAGFALSDIVGRAP